MEERRLKNVEKYRNRNFTSSCEIWHDYVDWDKGGEVVASRNGNFAGQSGHLPRSAPIGTGMG